LRILRSLRLILALFQLIVLTRSLPSCVNTSADFAVLALLVNLVALFGNGLEFIGFNDGLSSKFAAALKPPRHSIKSVREIRLRIEIGARVPLSRTRNVERQLHGAKTNLPQIFCAER